MQITDTIWLAVVTGLLTIIAALVAIGYRDFQTRLTRVEWRQSRVISSLLKFAIEPEPSRAHRLLADAIEQLLDNGTAGSHGD